MSIYDTGSCTGGVAVTPSDSTPLNFNQLYVGGTTGTVVVTTADGSILTFSGVPTGTFLPIKGTRVRAATTATLILALY